VSEFALNYFTALWHHWFGIPQNAAEKKWTQLDPRPLEKNSQPQMAAGVPSISLHGRKQGPTTKDISINNNSGKPKPTQA